ncbi:hypothetical protein HPB47_003021 [Ixodes persulcatus]|uniref:Uncharacterized protein n=1 Tax=Ixodes persulcatus TaxID=34615 RepID=A0AC60PJM6_IXOPE|nr:hypothetical protein HPB47_003021 [Ixodes persulcatus]
MEHAVFRAGRASDAGPGCITRWLPAALAREARRIRAVADDRSTTPCGVMFEESDSVVEKLIEGIRSHPHGHPSHLSSPTPSPRKKFLATPLNGVTPFQLVHSRKVTTMLDAMLPHEPADDWSDHAKVAQRVEEVCQLAQLRIQDQQRVNAGRYNLRRRNVHFQPGDVGLSKSGFIERLQATLKEAIQNIKVKEGDPTPDSHLLNLWVSRLKALERYKKEGKPPALKTKVNMATAIAKSCACKTKPGSTGTENDVLPFDFDEFLSLERTRRRKALTDLVPQDPDGDLPAEYSRSDRVILRPIRTNTAVTPALPAKLDRARRV